MDGKAAKFLAGFAIGAVLCAALMGLCFLYAWALIAFGLYPMACIIIVLVGGVFGVSFANSMDNDE